MLARFVCMPDITELCMQNGRDAMSFVMSLLLQFRKTGACLPSTGRLRQKYCCRFKPGLQEKSWASY